MINGTRIAIVFDDMVEFFSIKNGIDALVKEGIPVDLIVPLAYSERQALLDETFSEIRKHGYSPIREIDESIQYKILLEPNPSSHYFSPAKINHEYRIKYKYSLMTAKPAPIYSINRNMVYDAILCYTKREAEILSVHTKTFLVSPMRYKGFVKNLDRPEGKPILLYSPTFGKNSSISTVETALRILKNKYYIIVKAHHLTQYRDNEKDRISILKNNSDEYYDQTTDLVELLKRADVVLSDNSGSIFEAIYAEVPVAVYHPVTLNDRKFDKLDTYQHQLAKRGILPFTHTIDEIEAILKEAMKNQERQRAEKVDFLETDDLTSPFVNVIKDFLCQNRDGSEFYALHDIVRDTFNEQTERIASLEEEVSKLNEKTERIEYLEGLAGELSDLKNSKSYKLGRALTSPYRTIKGKAAR